MRRTALRAVCRRAAGTCGTLLAVGVALSRLLGGERAVTREQRAARALVDSVAGLAGVVRSAPDELNRARDALARGDSLIAAGDMTAAREGYSEAVVLTRLAVVEAQEEAARDSARSFAPMTAASDSL